MHLDGILDRLYNAEDEIERSEAAEQLSSYEGDAVTSALIEAMGDEDQLVVVASMESLKKRRTNPGPYLRAALLDPREMIRWGAADLLSWFPSEETEIALRQALGDESAHVRGEAARSLRAMPGDPATISALRKLVDDPDSFPRYQALRSLSTFAPQLVDEAQVIRRDLDSNDALTRLAAIHFIREGGKQEWLGEIERMLDDPDVRVRRAAQWARERLGENSG